MKVDLTTLDWDAVSAIATAVAVILALHQAGTGARLSRKRYLALLETALLSVTSAMRTLIGVVPHFQADENPSSIKAEALLDTGVLAHMQAALRAVPLAELETSDARAASMLAIAVLDQAEKDLGRVTRGEHPNAMKILQDAIDGLSKAETDLNKEIGWVKRGALSGLMIRGGSLLRRGGKRFRG